MVRCGNCLNFKKARVGVGGCWINPAKVKNDAICKNYEPRLKDKTNKGLVKTLTGESVLERCLPKHLSKKRGSIGPI